jgi:hypothetical protein
MDDLLWFALAMAVWFLLQRFLLPRLGVPS